jgi:hypothetical protein
LAAAAAAFLDRLGRLGVDANRLDQVARGLSGVADRRWKVDEIVDDISWLCQERSNRSGNRVNWSGNLAHRWVSMFSASTLISSVASSSAPAAAATSTDARTLLLTACANKSARVATSAARVWSSSFDVVATCFRCIDDGVNWFYGSFDGDFLYFVFLTWCIDGDGVTIFRLLYLDFIWWLRLLLVFDAVICIMWRSCLNSCGCLNSVLFDFLVRCNALKINENVKK